jgi:phytoene dehydrogenase-like protein
MTRQATIVGSGPNGLAAAVTLARAGMRVRVWEAADQPGGGARSAGLTLPGFVHDFGSAVHPAAIASPFFRALGLHRRVQWLIPEASYAHPLDDAPAAIAWRDLERTAQGLGADSDRWRALLRPLVRHLDAVVEFTGDQLLRMPRHPLVAARFGARMLEQGVHVLSRTGVRTTAAQALITGTMAHASTRLPSPAASAAGLLLAAHGHGGGWGLPRGGAGAITEALLAEVRAHGGQVETGRRIDKIGRAHV